MTEQNLAETNSNNQNSVSGAAMPATDVKTPAQEKMLSQSEVNELIGRAKNEAYERAKRESMGGVQPHQPIQPQSQPAQSMGGIQQQSPDDIRKMIDESVQNRLVQNQHELAVRQFSQQFEQKVLQGHQKYSDFGDVMRDLNIPELAKTNPGFIYSVGAVDNVADVLHDLRNNPQKLATLLGLTANPATQMLAQNQIKALSDSIKQNESAGQQKPANEPLSQVKPSTTGTDNGKLSVRDYKKADWLRA